MRKPRPFSIRLSEDQRELVEGAIVRLEAARVEIDLARLALDRVPGFGAEAGKIARSRDGVGWEKESVADRLAALLRVESLATSSQ